MGREGLVPTWGLWWRSHTLFIVFAVCMGSFTDLFLYGLIVPVMPFLLQDRINLPGAEVQHTISNLLAIYAGASLAASPLAGVLADKFCSSRQMPYLLGLVMLMSSTILFALGQSVFVLAIARLLQGASGGVVWTLGMTMIIETVGQENLGKTMGVVFSFISVAGLFSPTIGGLLYSTSGYQGVFGIGIGLIGVDFVLRMLLVEKRTAAKYTKSTLGAGARAVDGQNEDTEETRLLPSATVASDRHRLSPPKNRFTRTFPILILFQDAGLVTSLWIGFMQAMLLGAFDATIPLVASDQFQFNSLKAGLLFLPLGGVDFLFGPLFGWAVDRYGTRLFSILGFAGLVVTLVLLRLPYEPRIANGLQSGYVVALFSSLLAFNGLFLSMISSLAIVEAGAIIEQYCAANKDIFEQAPYAQLYGINSMIWSAGLTIGPLVAGVLKERIGYGNMNAVLGGVCAWTAICSALFMGRNDKNKKQRARNEE